MSYQDVNELKNLLAHLPYTNVNASMLCFVTAKTSNYVVFT